MVTKASFSQVIDLEYKSGGGNGNRIWKLKVKCIILCVSAYKSYIRCIDRNENKQR